MHKLVRMYLCAVFAALAVCMACAESSEAVYSDIKADESVVFFRTSAWLDEATREWQVPIHGWIYEPEDSTTRMALFASILENKFGLVPNDDTRENFSSRLNMLIADNERGKQITINIAGERFTLPVSAANGHFETTLRLPIDDVEPFIRNSRLRYSAVTHAEESRRFGGDVLFVAPAGLSIISDIDDTVKISEVTDRTKLLENTFLLDFAAAPGMAQLFRRWSENDTSFHFVSSSPWQLYTPLLRFLDDAEFPSASLNLKSVRFRDETLFDLFKKGTATKPQVIEGILATYPGRQFILVGDSGEQDPEVYAKIIRDHPEQVLKIYIRNVSSETVDNERFRSVFQDIDGDCWQLFEHPSEIQPGVGASSTSP